MIGRPSARAVLMRGQLNAPRAGRGRARKFDHDVRGLDVAMDETFEMGMMKRLRNFEHQPGGLLKRELATFQQIFERDSFNEIRNDCGERTVGNRFVNGHDARMLERSGRLGLAPETFLKIGRLDQARMRDLERDNSLEVRVKSAPDDPESALANAIEKSESR